MELTAAVTTQDLHRSSPSTHQHGWGRTHKLSPLTEELLTVDGCWKWQSRFFPGMWILVGSLVPTVHTQAGIIRFSEFLIKDLKFSQGHIRGSRRLKEKWEIYVIKSIG